MGGLTQYIGEQLTKGYNINDIRTSLLRFGYSVQLVDQAISNIHQQKPQFTYHISHGITASIIIIGALLLGCSIYFLLPKESPPQLTLNTATATPEQELAITYAITNFEEPVSLTYTVSTDKGKTISRGKTTLTEKEGSFSITPPRQSGQYHLSMQGQIQGKRITASTTITISETLTTTCDNGIIDIGEEGLDCGGSCKPCPQDACKNSIKDAEEENIDCGGPCKSCQQTYTVTCDDNNPCTQDRLDQGSCKSTPILPCCGNSVCEQQELTTCELDCSSQTVRDFYNLPVLDVIDKAIDLASTDPAQARSLCNSITPESFADNCYREVSAITQSVIDCDYITVQKKKDSCYTDVANAKKDIEACLLIVNNDSRDFCIQKLQNNHGIYACEKYTNTLLKEGCEFLSAEQP